MVPKDLLDLILSYHRPIVEQMFAGNPKYTLYWAYDKSRLKEMLGMTHGKYKLIRSRLGRFLRRVPETRFFVIQWIGGRVYAQARVRTSSSART